MHEGTVGASVSGRTGRAGRAVIGPRLDSAAVGLCWRLSVWS